MTFSAMPFDAGPFDAGRGRSSRDGKRSAYAARRAALDSSAEVGPERLAEELTRLPRDVFAAVVDHMDEHGITRAALAARMGVSPGRVSQILCGGENVTLRTLATVAAALGARFEVSLTSDDADDVLDALAALPARGPAREHLQEPAKLASQ